MTEKLTDGKLLTESTLRNPCQKALAETTSVFKQLNFEAFSKAFNEADMRSVKESYFITLPDKIQRYFPKWFKYHGLAIGIVMLVIVVVVAIITNVLSTMEMWFGIILSVLMILFGGSRDFAEVREQWFANDNANVDYHYHSDMYDTFTTEPEDIEPDAAYFMTPEVPEYRWGLVADDFYVTDRLVINNQAYEAGTWHYGVVSSDGEGSDTTDWKEVSYSLYDVKIKLPTVRFKLKHALKQRKRINVTDHDDDPSKEMSLKAGFDEKIATSVMSLDDRETVVNLFTDDVLATIYDMFDQHPNMTEIECDNTQVVIIWKEAFDDMTKHNEISIGDNYIEMFGVMHEVARQICENLDNSAN